MNVLNVFFIYSNRFFGFSRAKFTDETENICHRGMLNL